MFLDEYRQEITMTKLDLMVEHITRAIDNGSIEYRLPSIIQCYTCPKTRPPVCNRKCKECWGERVMSA